MEIGDKVARLRREFGLSQGELAKRIGEKAKQQNIQQLESGTVKQPRYLSRLATVLGVSYDDLLDQSRGVATEPTSGQETPRCAGGAVHEAPPEYRSLTDILDELAERLNKADPSVREEVVRLILRYLDTPQSSAKIAQAIDLLLSIDDDSPP